MNKILNSLIRPAIRMLGIDIVRYPSIPMDLDELTKKIFHSVKKFTLSSAERVNALVESVKYLAANEIEGDLVECGVWKGGSAMAMALTLRELHDETREVYLYDTFSGMTSPDDVDISYIGELATDKFSQTKTSEESSTWALSPLEEVIQNVRLTGYPMEKFHFIKGMVENTLPKEMPQKIALLRLDTDWYKSTKHELIHLFPLLSKHGVLIVDDYGHWAGCKKAVDEYILENNICIFLNRIDYTGRVGIKVVSD